MARKKAYKKIDIDVEPFLSIMAIVLKLISLVLVVIVMRIAINPKAKRIIALTGLYSGHGNYDNPKSPSYIDCGPDGLTLYPGAMTVNWDQLQHPDNPVDQLLDKIQADSSNQYVVVMVRPRSVKYYRTVRSMISKRPIDVGYDAVDEDFKVNWDAERKALAISTD